MRRTDPTSEDWTRIMGMDVADDGALVVAYRNENGVEVDAQHIGYVGEYASPSDIVATWPDPAISVAVGAPVSAASMRASFSTTHVADGSLASEGLEYATDAQLPAGLALSPDGLLTGTATTPTATPLDVAVRATVLVPTGPTGKPRPVEISRHTFQLTVSPA